MSQQENQENFLLCVDPETGTPYSLSLKKYDIIIEKNASAAYKKKIQEAIQTMQYLRDHRYPNFKSGEMSLRDSQGMKDQNSNKESVGSISRWLFESEEIKRFRRRRLQEYLIVKDSGNYPVFVSESKMSEAFADKSYIIMRVDIGDYKETIQKQITNDVKVQKILVLEAQLVSGADEIVKGILREIYKLYKVKLKPDRTSNYFVLKILGYREYLLRDHPLLDYERTRICLRSNTDMQVTFTEIPQDTELNQNYPPIFQRNRFNIQNGTDTIDWGKLEKIPVFLWYPPYEITPQHLSEEKYTQDINESIKRSMSHQLTRPRALNQLLVSEFRLNRRRMAIDSVFSTSQNEVFTGECDFPFSLRICGTENLTQILQYFLNDATFNGETQMPYITLQKEQQQGGHGSKKNKKKGKKQVVNIPKLCNDSDSREEKEQYAESSHYNHASYQNHVTTFANKLQMPFIPYAVNVVASLYYGNQLLTQKCQVESKLAPFSDSIRWFEWLTFDSILISQLPQELRLCFEIKAYPSKGEPMVIGLTSIQLFDEKGKMRQGMIPLNIWPFYKLDARLTCMEQFWYCYRQDICVLKDQNLKKQFIYKNFPKLFIQIERFTQVIYWSLRDEVTMNSIGFSIYKEQSDKALKLLLNSTPTNENLAKLQKLIKRDPLSRNFTEEEKNNLILCRNHYKAIPSALPIFLQAIDWCNPELVAEAHKMLGEWAPMNPEEAICLLDTNFPDEAVRYYAVQRISELSDDILTLYMLQLSQALMFEPQHLSPLGEMLLLRSLQNPYVVGHEFFWQLRSQLHIKPSLERYTALLEQFVMLCGSYREELADECQLNETIGQIANQVTLKSKAEKLNYLRMSLFNLNSQVKRFNMALDCRLESSGFYQEKCKVLDSKKEPIWITLKPLSVDMSSIGIIYKAGDDLRQDILTLQLIRIMDKIWLDNGLDLKMRPYKVIATMDMYGMIEIVQNSETTAKIQKFEGAVIGALSTTCIIKYLKKFNPSQNEFTRAKKTFMRSCAGYIIATFLLGIGDRHSDNIMVSQFGHLFHIDFGHFLGNFKGKFGIKRERSPFVFTPEMYEVIVIDGKENYAIFEQICIDAFNLVRQKGFHFINMFLIMLSAGMPELMQPEDIEYLKIKLLMNLTDQEAAIQLKKELEMSRQDEFRRLDNIIHNLNRT